MIKVFLNFFKKLKRIYEILLKVLKTEIKTLFFNKIFINFR